MSLHRKYRWSVSIFDSDYEDSWFGGGSTVPKNISEFTGGNYSSHKRLRTTKMLHRFLRMISTLPNKPNTIQAWDLKYNILYYYDLRR